MNEGSFKKGNVPFNKGLKMTDYVSTKSVEKIKSTQFKKGDNAGEKNNTWKGGVQIIQNDCVHIYTGVNTRLRRPKNVYEKNGLTIPSGWVVYHLDGLKHNDEIENLIAIPRAILMKLCSKRLTSSRIEIEKEIKAYLK